ncbi:MAG: hypothetical protein GY930_15470 [bacterium]|nr:hypothetical protein [bacterium]
MKVLSRSRPVRSARQGSALVAAMVMIMAIAVISTTFLTASVDSSKKAESSREAFRVKSAATSAVNMAVERFWSDFQILAESQTVPGIRTYLDGLGVRDGAASVDVLNLMGGLEMAQSDSMGNLVGGAVIEDVRVVREDLGNSIELRFSALARESKGRERSTGQQTVSVEQIYSVEPADWSGLEFALFANNVNCILCHASIDSAERFHNDDPALRGTFDRIKVGTLNELMMRTSAHSSIAGTVYVRGKAVERNGALITNWAAQTLKGKAIDSYGKIVEDAFGNMSTVDLVDDPTNPSSLNNLYLGYGENGNEMVDGDIPESFPSPFPDTGGNDPMTIGNRMVDPAEFAEAATVADGTLTGGSISIVPDGANLGDPASLSSALSAGASLTLASTTSGNVVLVGTEANPILLNGPIAVDGDLIISGVVKGEGSLTVSGNIYVPTDLVYADGLTQGGGRMFGSSTDGTTNALALASGGSIMVGDLFHVAGTSNRPASFENPAITGNESGSFSFVLDEVATFNRGEWAKTQAVLPGQGDDSNDPSTWSAVNPNFDPDHVPRYYVFNDSGTVPIHNRDLYYNSTSNTWIGPEHAGSWGSNGLTLAYPGDPNDPILYGAGRPAALHSLAASDGWMSDALLSFYLKSERDAHERNEPLKIDAFLYSNNSIFGIVPKRGPMRGQLEINGAIVAADVGLLIPGAGGVGLQLNFDNRSADLLNLNSEEGISMRRKIVVPHHQ